MKIHIKNKCNLKSFIVNIGIRYIGNMGGICIGDWARMHELEMKTRMKTGIGPG